MILKKEELLPSNIEDVQKIKALDAQEEEYRDRYAILYKKTQELEEQIKDNPAVQAEYDTLLIQYGDARSYYDTWVLSYREQKEKLQENILTRYYRTFDNNYDLFIEDVKDILRHITKDDFMQLIHIWKEIESDPRTTEEYSKHIRTEGYRAKSFHNACRFLSFTLYIQFGVLEYYSFDDTDIKNFIEVKANEWYRKKESEKITTAEMIEYLSADTEFPFIRQGNITNSLTKFRATPYTTDIDAYGHPTGHIGSLSIRGLNDLTGLKTSTYQLLDMVTIKMTGTGTKSPTVELTIDDYMKSRKLSDRKSAREQVRRELEELKSLSLEWNNKTITEQDKKLNKLEYGFINVAEKGYLTKSGIIHFTFTNSFFYILKAQYLMPYPDQLLAINSNKNPNSYSLGRKIAELRHMNTGKRGEDIISIKTLLENAPYIPKYEDVLSGNRNVKERIIDAFERDMNALSFLTWNYCHSKGAPLTESEQRSISYDRFKDLSVRIVWRNYPQRLLPDNHSYKKQGGSPVHKRG